MSGLNDMFVTCWYCGVLGDVAGVIESCESAVPVRVVVDWRTPSGSHEHSPRPPTPAELEQAGREALARIRGVFLDPRAGAATGYLPGGPVAWNESVRGNLRVMT